jgi:hypothetical protein
MPVLITQLCTPLGRSQRVEISFLIRFTLFVLHKKEHSGDIITCVVVLMFDPYKL